MCGSMYTWVCVSVCIHVSVHMCICVHCEYARVRVYPQCVGMSLHVYVCMCECVYMCTCACTCVDVCEHVCITRDTLLVWLHTHVSVHMNVYMCT